MRTIEEFNDYMDYNYKTKEITDEFGNIFTVLDHKGTTDTMSAWVLLSMIEFGIRIRRAWVNGYEYFKIEE